MLLSLPGARPTPVEVVSLLEELAREMPAEAVSMHFLAALVADGQGHPETAQRLLREALRRAGDRPSLALVRRHVASEQNRNAARAGPGGPARGAGPEHRPDPGRRPPPRHLPVLPGRRGGGGGRQAGAGREALPARPRARARAPAGAGPAAQAAAGAGRLAGGGRRPRARGRSPAPADPPVAGPAPGGRARRPIICAIPGGPAACSSGPSRPIPATTRRFTRLRKLLEEAGELDAVTELLARRLAGASPEDVTALRLERVDLLLGPLGDRPPPRPSCAAARERAGQRAASWAGWPALELEDGDHGAAAELSIRQARFERDPAALEACFLRIGRLYMRPPQRPPGGAGRLRAGAAHLPRQPGGPRGAVGALRPPERQPQGAGRHRTAGRAGGRSRKAAALPHPAGHPVGGGGRRPAGRGDPAPGGRRVAPQPAVDRRAGAFSRAAQGAAGAQGPAGGIAVAAELRPAQQPRATSRPCAP